MENQANVMEMFRNQNQIHKSPSK